MWKPQVSITLTNCQPRITVHSLDNLSSLCKEKDLGKVLNGQDGQPFTRGVS